MDTCSKFVGDEKLSWQELGKKAASQVSVEPINKPHLASHFSQYGAHAITEPVDEKNEEKEE